MPKFQIEYTVFLPEIVEAEDDLEALAYARKTRAKLAKAAGLKATGVSSLARQIPEHATYQAEDWISAYKEDGQ